MSLLQNISNYVIYPNYITVLDDGKLNNYNRIYLTLHLVNYDISSYKLFNVIYTLDKYINNCKIVVMKELDEIRIRYFLNTSIEVKELESIKVKDKKKGFTYCLLDIPITFYNVYELAMLFN